PLPGVHQRDGVQPHGRDAPRPVGEDRHGSPVGHLPRHPGPGRRASRQRLLVDRPHRDRPSVAYPMGAVNSRMGSPEASSMVSALPAMMYVAAFCNAARYGCSTFMTSSAHSFCVAASGPKVSWLADVWYVPWKLLHPPEPVAVPPD